MKRTNKLLILLGILVVAVVATVIVMRHEEKTEQIKNSGQVILAVAADDVESLSWDNGTDELAFHREDTWLYDDDTAFPVSQDKIDDLLSMFQEFTAAFVIEDVEDFSQYGLDEPVCTVQFATDSEEYEVKAGSYSVMDSERYISTGDGNVYLVEDDPVEHFSAALSDMIDHDTTPSFSDVTSIQFSGDENLSVAYEENSAKTWCDEDVYFCGDKPLDTDKVESYLRAITNLTLSDYVSYNVTDEELTQYGLDAPDITVDVTYTDSDEEAAEFSLALSAQMDENEIEAAYARVGASQIVYQISTSDYESLAQCTYNDLRHSEIFTAEFDTVTGITIFLDEEEYAITTEKPEDGDSAGETVYLYQDEEIDISGFKSKLNAVNAFSFTSEEPEQKLEIGLVLELDNENYPELDIEFYRYDGEYCLAVVNGEPVALVNRSEVVDLIEAVNAIVL